MDPTTSLPHRLLLLCSRSYCRHCSSRDRAPNCISPDSQTASRVADALHLEYCMHAGQTARPRRLGFPPWDGRRIHCSGWLLSRRCSRRKGWSACSPPQQRSERHVSCASSHARNKGRRGTTHPVRRGSTEWVGGGARCLLCPDAAVLAWKNRRGGGASLLLGRRR